MAMHTETIENGDIKTRYNYTPFGEPEVSGDTAANPFMFTGREYDEGTRLYYYRARYYSWELGRFISEDPIGLAGGINMYAYVSNSPINFVDPLGLLGLDGGGTGLGNNMTPTKLDTHCLKICIEENNFWAFITAYNLSNTALNATPLGKTPRGGISMPPHPTTWQHTVGSKLMESTGEVSYSYAGKAIGRYSVYLTLVEGFYDWGLIGVCLVKCTESTEGTCENKNPSVPRFPNPGLGSL